MAATPSPSAFSRKQRHRRRLLLVGGFTVPAAVLGGAFVALPANAATAVDAKAVLTKAVSEASADKPVLITLGADLVDDDATDDTQTIKDGTSVTIDLAGHTLDLDQFVVGGGSRLYILDSAPKKGLLALDAELTSKTPQVSGITLGDDALLDVAGAHVTSTGSDGRAGIGLAQADNDAAPQVLLESGAVVSATGGTGAAGVGAAAVQLKGASQLTAANGTASDQTAPASAVGGADGSDDFGSLTVDKAATLTLPTGSTLRVPAKRTVTNNGTIVLNGVATGAGTIVNAGTIVPSTAKAVGLAVTGNSFAVTVNTNGGSSSTAIPGSVALYAPTFAALKDYTPTKDGAYFDGWNTAVDGSGKTIASDTPLTGVVGASTGEPVDVHLYAQYAADIAVTGPTHLYVAKNTASTDVPLPVSGSGITVVKKTGALPAGLQLTEAGHLVGSATTNGLSAFTVTVTSKFGETKDVDLQVSVGAKPAITTTGALPLVTLGKPYSTTIGSTGNGTVTLSATGLPSGFSIDSEGTISGTTSGAEAEAPITVTASSEFGSISKALVLSLGQVPAIASTPLKAVTIGEAYSAKPAIAGKGGPVLNVDEKSDPLPAGLSIKDGAITGTYEGAPGSATFTLRATSDFGTSTQQFTVALGEKPSISTKPLPAITIDEPYSATLTADGDGAPTFALADGQELPAGLELDEKTGVISGTYSGAPASFTIIATATSSFGESQTDYTVEAATAPVITNDADAVVRIGEDFSEQIAFTGGTTHATYALAKGDVLPEGLDLDPKTGAITGTAKGEPGTVTFTVVVTTDFGSAKKTIAAAVGSAPSFEKDAVLHPATTGVKYVQKLPASGTSVKYTASSKDLPDWANLSADGELTGDAPTKGTWTFTVTAKSIFGTATHEYTIDGGAAPVIRTSRVPRATVGAYYETSVVSTGDGDVSYTVTDGKLPGGLTLDAKSGLISGSVLKAGPSSFEITATTPFGHVARTFALTAGAAPSLPSATDLPVIVVGSDYTATVPSKGDGAVTFTVTKGTLPGNLALDAKTGVLSGAVKDESSTTIEITATSDFGTTQHSYTLTAGFAPEVSTSSDDLAAVTVDSAYSDVLAADGSGDIAYSIVDGALPTGLTLASNGTLSGKATAAGSFTFTVKASSAFGSEKTEYTLVAGAAPTFGTRALPAATVGTAYSTPVVTAGGGDVTLALTKGTLPKGLALDLKTGVLSGTPTAEGQATITLTASSRYGRAVTDLTIAVAPKPAEPVTAPDPVKTPEPVKAADPVKTTPPVKAADPVKVADPVKAPDPVKAADPVKTTAPAATAPVLPVVPTATGKLGRKLTLSVAASSTVDVGYALQGALPAGLVLNTDTGVITGTPKASGTFTFSVKASSSAGSDVQRYSIAVPEKTSVVSGTASRSTPTMDRPVAVTTSALKKGERWRIAVDGRTVATGVAARAGKITKSIDLPVTKRDHTYTIRVSGSRPVTDAATKAWSEFDVTAVSVNRSLKLKSSAGTVKVTGLAPREAVTVTEKGRTVASGRADAKGVFTVGASTLKAGRHALVAQGALKGRTGSATVKISH